MPPAASRLRLTKGNPGRHRLPHTQRRRKIESIGTPARCPLPRRNELGERAALLEFISAKKNGHHQPQLEWQSGTPPGDHVSPMRAFADSLLIKKRGSSAVVG